MKLPSRAHLELSVTRPPSRATVPHMDASHIRVEIMPMPRGRVSCEVSADGEVWGVTVENRAEAWAVAFSAVRGIVRTRRLRAAIKNPLPRISGGR